MDLGFIRVAAAVPKVEVGDCVFNAGRMIDMIEKAEQEQVHIIVFPELSITSYTAADLFHQKHLLDSSSRQLQRIAESTADKRIIAIVGLPVPLEHQLFNCAAVIQKGEVLGIIPKQHIPNHSEFFERRWFAPASSANEHMVKLAGHAVPFGTDLLFEAGDCRFGVEICEDLWVPIPPSSTHCLHGANIIFNLSASPEVIGKSEYRRQLVAQQSASLRTGYVYVSSGTGESTSDVVFGGDAMIAENGMMLALGERLTDNEQLLIADMDVDRLNADRRKVSTFMGSKERSRHHHAFYRIIPVHIEKLDVTPETLRRAVDAQPFVPKGLERRDDRCHDIFAIQVAGLAKRLRHIGSETAVIGVSGGLDSTLALLVIANTFDRLKLPREQIIGITMPGFGTTDRTYQNAVKLMKALGITTREIDIKAASLQHFKDIGHDPDVHDTTYENTQARERTQILMDIANKEGGIVVGTGDLSELALGWATYNGDHMSMYAVNSGVPKTLVRYLVSWVADHLADDASAAILHDILDTPVSPELLPAKNGEIKQKTEDIVGPYELHDFFLYNMVRYGFTPGKIYFLAQAAFGESYEKAEIKKWLTVFYRRFFTQQFKRSCMPDGPKVGTINLSPRGDWKMPSDASGRIWLDEVERLEL